MPTPVVVIGHRNPDNDSISAAVGYAYLKNQLAKRDGTDAKFEYFPGRLGPLPRGALLLAAKVFRTF